MWNLWKVGTVVVDLVAHLDPSICLAYKCIVYINKECAAFHMCHVLVWHQSACGNSYLISVHRVFFCVKHKILVKETSLLHNIFYHFGAQNLHSYARYTICIYNLSLDLFCVFHHPKYHVCVIHYTSVCKDLVLN